MRLLGMSHPCRTRTHRGSRFSRNSQFSAQGCILEAGWFETSTQKLRVQSWTGDENFIKIYLFHLKLFNFFLRTNKQTHTLPSIYRQMNFNALFDTFHSTMFVKDKWNESGLSCWSKIPCGSPSICGLLSSTFIKTLWPANTATSSQNRPIGA